MRQKLWNAILIAAIVLWAISILPPGPTQFWVEKIYLSDRTEIQPVGIKHRYRPHSTSMYWFMRSRSTTIHHLLEQPTGGKLRTVFSMEEDKEKLYRTEKEVELETGGFGALVSHKTCYYNRPVDSYQSNLVLEFEPLEFTMSRTIPNSILTMPQGTFTPTSFAIERTIEADDTTEHAVGNYEADGKLEDVAIQIDGDALHSSRYRELAGAPKFKELALKYGLPEQVDIHAYLDAGRLPLSLKDNAQPRAFAIVTYDYGKLFRVDELRGGKRARSRILQPLTSEEENILGPECDLHLRDQHAKGQPTIW